MVRKHPDTGEFLILPDLLALLLRSDLVYGQVVHHVLGIGRLRLSLSPLLRTLIPVPPPDVQHEMLEQYYTSAREAAHLVAQGQDLVTRAQSLVAEAEQRLARALLRQP